MLKKSPKILALIIAASIIAATTAGCQKTVKTSSNDSTTVTVDTSKELTLDVYDDFANFNGQDTGWYADFIKKKFNISLNIIHDATGQLFQTRSASGDLGDIIVYSDDKIPNTIKAGLLYDMTKGDLLKKYGQDINKYPAAIKKLQKANNTGNSVYNIPNNVSSQSATTPSEIGDLTFGLYMPWELYTAAGSPKLNTIDDLYPTLKAMHDKKPKTADGKPTYAFSIFKDWDGDGMTLASQMSTMYGWASQGVLEYNGADLTQTRSWLDPNSYYMKSLKMYFQANQDGLLDPDSATQNWDTFSNKFLNAQILFSWWSFCGKPTYNTAANTAEGKGYMFIPVADEKVLSNGNTPAGGTYSIAMGSKCKDPARVMQFIDWLYSPEGAEVANNGPKGLTWSADNGKHVVTAFGMNAYTNGKNTIVPGEYGGGSYADGVGKMNFATLNTTDIDPSTNETYRYNGWTSYLTATNTKLTQDWSKAMGGAVDMMDYLKKNKQLTIMPGSDYVSPKIPDEIVAIENQCKNVIAPYSYKLIFAKSQADFDSIYNDMVKQCNGFGIEKVNDWYKADIAKHGQAIKDTVAASK